MRLRPALVLLLTVSCSTTPATDTTTPPPASAPTATPAVTPAAAPAAAGRSPIVNPNQASNDAAEKAVLESIAGRENEPAEKVFHNIQMMKGMPAGRLVRVMNMGYSRALGVSCLHCHASTDFASDAQRPKNAAREMMTMTRSINEHLKKIQNLDRTGDEPFVNCTTCHRGNIDPNTGLR